MLEKNLEKTIGIYYFLILRKYFFFNEGDLYIKMNENLPTLNVNPKKTNNVT